MSDYKPLLFGALMAVFGFVVGATHEPLVIAPVTIVLVAWGSSIWWLAGEWATEPEKPPTKETFT